MQIRKLTLIITNLILLFSIMSRAEEKITSEKFSLYYIPERTGISIEGFLSENDPPYVNNVKISPQNPGIADEIIVEAEILNNPMLTTNRPLIADLSYSTDDGLKWTKIEMEQDTGAPNYWHATIPPIGKPATVRYFLTAQDDSGNHLIELPVSDVLWGGIKPPRLTGAVTDDNDDPRMVFDDLDILQAQVGYDGEILYFAMKVEGNISGGTISPVSVHVYSVGIYYPELIKDRTVRTEFVLEHAQHAQFVHFPVIGFLNTEKELTEVRIADPRYYSDGSWLYMRFKQDALKNKKFDKLRIIFGTAYATNYAPVVLKPVDTTRFINIARSDRSFVVK